MIYDVQSKKTCLFLSKPQKNKRVERIRELMPEKKSDCYTNLKENAEPNAV